MKEKSRRNFLKKGSTFGLIAAATGVAAIAGGQSPTDNGGDKKGSGKKIKVLTTEGKVIEIEDPNTDCAIQPCTPPQGEAARQGIPGRSFVMVIDLSRCKNARKCIEACQHGHDLLPDQEFMNVHLMKDNPDSEPYWFPKNCYHCDNPPCVKVCPVGATFKRQDNLVLVDVDQCIGCKFCMVACPYSARIFQWTEPGETSVRKEDYSPETSVPAQIGTVSKCDFCADRSREGKLPYCATGCPMGAIYFGDKNEDAISNGTETVRFTQLIKERMGYRYLEELGTEPNVYYLPPVDRMFDYKDGLGEASDEQREIYERIISGENTKKD